MLKHLVESDPLRWVQGKARADKAFGVPVDFGVVWKADFAQLDSLIGLGRVGRVEGRPPYHEGKKYDADRPVVYLKAVLTGRCEHLRRQIVWRAADRSAHLLDSVELSGQAEIANL